MVGRNTRRRRPTGPVRVGLYGVLGADNIGNDATLDAVLGFLRRDHPGIVLDAMSTHPEQLSAIYGFPAEPLSWQHPWRHPYVGAGPRPVSLLILAAGKVSQTIRTMLWARRHDVVIVPGAGVLETSVPMRPWETPYALFVVCAAGRLFGTKVAMLSVGAEPGTRRATRALLDGAARMCTYRSYRDERSRTSMSDRGIDVSDDHVFADMAFHLPVKDNSPGVPGAVGIGVMKYSGNNDDDRSDGPAIYAEYEQAMKSLVLRLVDSGRRVTLLVGDQCDYPVADAIIAEIRSRRTDLAPDAVTAAGVRTFSDLLDAVAPLSVVMATRFHNLVAALMLGKPTVSADYAAKSTDLMTGMGLGRFTHPIRDLDVDRLMSDIETAESQGPQLRGMLLERVQEKVELIEGQFAEASRVLFPPA